MRTFKICCPSCCADYAQTTENFDRYTPNGGDALEIRTGFDFPDFDGIHCPSCGAEIMADGFTSRMVEIKAQSDEATANPEELPIVVPDEDGRVICPECDKELTAKGFKRHYRQAHLND